MWKSLRKEVADRHPEVKAEALDAFFSQLKAAYGQSERVYHTIEHLTDLWGERKKKEKEGWSVLKQPALTWALLSHDWVQGEDQRDEMMILVMNAMNG